MNLDAFKSVRDELTVALAQRERDPFPIFLRAWVLSVLPFILMCFLLAHWPRPILLWLLTALVAGFVQNALGLLMHEGSHYFFHRSKKASDIWCDVLVCLPIFNTVQGYRTPHFEHHRSSGENADPYFNLYTYSSVRDLVRQFLVDCVGISALQRFFYRYGSNGTGKAAKHIPAYAAPVFLLVQLGLWFLLFRITGQWYAWFVLWVAPLMTVTLVVNRFRTIVEHYPGFLGIKVSRTTITGWFEYLCVAPYGYGHHLEHHLMPQVPYYDLAFTHRFLAARVDYGENDVATFGYLNAFRRLVRELRKIEKKAAS